MPRTRYKVYSQGCPHFLSSSIVNWIPLFSDPDQVEVLLTALRFLHEENRLRLHGYVIMENNFHLVASSAHFERDMRSLKSYSAKGFLSLLESKQHLTRLEELKWRKLRHKQEQTYQVWQEGYHPQQISSYEMLLQKLDYIHENPVRRGYVDDPAHWRYSSYRNYNGMEGVLPIERITM
jgi:putative transposase